MRLPCPVRAGVIESGGQWAAGMAKSDYKEVVMNSPSTSAVPVGEQAVALRLARRLLARPGLCQRVESILDITDRDIENGYTADQAEARVRDLTRALAQETLQGWAEAVATRVTDQSLAQQPDLIRHSKKKSAGTRRSVPSP